MASPLTSLLASASLLADLLASLLADRLASLLASLLFSLASLSLVCYKISPVLSAPRPYSLRREMRIIFRRDPSSSVQGQAAHRNIAHIISQHIAERRRDVLIQ